MNPIGNEVRAVLEACDGISTADVAVFFIISSIVNNKTRSGFITQQRLAQVAKCSERTVRRSVDRLKELGLLSVVPGSNRQASNYTVHLDMGDHVDTSDHVDVGDQVKKRPRGQIRRSRGHLRPVHVDMGDRPTTRTNYSKKLLTKPKDEKWEREFKSSQVRSRESASSETTKVAARGPKTLKRRKSDGVDAQSASTRKLSMDEFAEKMNRNFESVQRLKGARR